MPGGGRGSLVASQVCVGDANDLAIAVYCDEAGLHWRQEQPNELVVGRRDRPAEIWGAGANRAYLPADLTGIQRTPGGHPEGYLEAFANIYAAFGRHIRGEAAAGDEPGFATMEDALAGMIFIRASLESQPRGRGLGRSGERGEGADRMKGPAIFLAQFAGDEAPFNSLDAITRWAAGLGYKGVQIPTWDARLIDLAKAAESQDYVDELKGICAANGVEVTELSTHLQGQLVATHPAYDKLFDGFAPPQLHGNPAARQEWAVEQLKLAARASRRFGVRCARDLLRAR